MYFTIGGRQTQSGFYRVTYVGNESTSRRRAARTPVPRPGPARTSWRRSTTSSIPKAVEAAWPYLGHEDRYIRFAARVAIEHQDPKTWQERALSEKDPARAIDALLALVRATGQDPFHHPRKPGDPVPGADLQGPILEALARIDFDKLSAQQRRDTAARLRRPVQPHWASRSEAARARSSSPASIRTSPATAAS